MDFDKYISDLLLQHDCVIVPDFGGFVANYASAKVHSSQHTFTPPFKNVVFNKNLKANDGLLAHHITIAEKISYSDACKFIAGFVNDSVKNLRNGNAVQIKNVGELYLDVEQNIQFDPDKSFNYLADSFGLTTFHSPPIKRENYRTTIPKKFLDRRPLPEGRKKINIKRYATIALVIPLLFVAFWIPLKTDLMRNINYSSLNPFSKNKIEAPVETINAEPEPSKSVDEIPASTIQSVKPVAPVASELVATENKSKKYHVIGGCFAVHNNAKKLVKRLKKKGYNASIIDQFNSLYRVKYNSYANKNEAIEALVTIRSSNPDAWLLVK